MMINRSLIEDRRLSNVTVICRAFPTNSSAFCFSIIQLTDEDLAHLLVMQQVVRAVVALHKRVQSMKATAVEVAFFDSNQMRAIKGLRGLLTQLGPDEDPVRHMIDKLSIAENPLCFLGDIGLSGEDDSLAAFHTVQIEPSHVEYAGDLPTGTIRSDYLTTQFLERASRLMEPQTR